MAGGFLEEEEDPEDEEEPAAALTSARFSAPELQVFASWDALTHTSTVKGQIAFGLFSPLEDKVHFEKKKRERTHSNNDGWCFSADTSIQTNYWLLILG